MIQIKYFATLAEAIKKRDETLELDGKSIVLKDLLEILGRKYKEAFDIHRNYLITVNGRDIKFLNDLRIELHDGDVVSIVPPVMGGSF